MNYFSGLLCLMIIGFYPSIQAEEIKLTEQQIKQLAIELGHLKPATQSLLLTAPAKIVVPPQQEYTVSTPQTGLINQLYFAVGDQVNKNQLIAEIHSPELLTLQQRYLQINNQRQLAWENYQRDQKLFNEGIIPGKRWQESRSQYQNIHAEFESISQMLAISGLSTNQIRDLTQQHLLNPRLMIVAPIQGVILEQLVMTGERVNALSPMYKIAHLSPLWLEIAIPQEQIAQIQIGNEVQIEAYSTTATVQLLGNSVNPETQTITVRAVIDHPSSELRPGQMVKAQLIQRRNQIAYQVPNTALAQYQGRSYLFIRQAQGFQIITVKVLAKQANDSIISGQLKGTESIAIRGAVALKANWLHLGSEE